MFSVLKLFVILQISFSILIVKTFPELNSNLNVILFKFICSELELCPIIMPSKAHPNKLFL